MKVSSFFSDERGWSIASIPKLDSPQTAVLVFGGANYLNDPRRIHELASMYPKSQLIGCSTAGEIAGNRVLDEGLAVAVLKLEHSQVEVASEPIRNAAQSFDVGERLARDLYRPDISAVIVFADGCLVNGAALVRGLNAVLPTHVIVTGGLAGDGERFQQTWVLDGKEPKLGYVSAIAFYGQRMRVGHGTLGGWDTVGTEHLVTRACGNTLYELDKKPALDLYRELIGGSAEMPGSGLRHPLMVRANVGGARGVLRTLTGFDPEKRSLTFAAEIPIGCRAQVMSGQIDRLIEGASEAAAMSSPGTDGESPTFALAISCARRRQLLGNRSSEEVRATLQNLPEGTQQIGFYAYGGIAPQGRAQRSDLHNQMMTVATLTED